MPIVSIRVETSSTTTLSCPICSCSSLIWVRSSSRAWEAAARASPDCLTASWRSSICFLYWTLSCSRYPPLKDTFRSRALILCDSFCHTDSALWPELWPPFPVPAFESLPVPVAALFTFEAGAGATWASVSILSFAEPSDPDGPPGLATLSFPGTEGWERPGFDGPPWSLAGVGSILTGPESPGIASAEILESSGFLTLVGATLS